MYQELFRIPGIDLPIWSFGLTLTFLAFAYEMTLLWSQ